MFAYQNKAALHKILHNVKENETFNVKILVYMTMYAVMLNYVRMGFISMYYIFGAYVHWLDYRSPTQSTTKHAPCLR